MSSLLETSILETFSIPYKDTASSRVIIESPPLFYDSPSIVLISLQIKHILSNVLTLHVTDRLICLSRKSKLLALSFFHILPGKFLFCV